MGSQWLKMGFEHMFRLFRGVETTRDGRGEGLTRIESDRPIAIWGWILRHVQFGQNGRQMAQTKYWAYLGHCGTKGSSVRQHLNRKPILRMAGTTQKGGRSKLYSILFSVCKNTSFAFSFWGGLVGGLVSCKMRPRICVLHARCTCWQATCTWPQSSRMRLAPRA